jgi:hypothetical protein
MFRTPHRLAVARFQNLHPEIQMQAIARFQNLHPEVQMLAVASF